MSIGVITTWPPQMSGLSEYSKYLYETIAQITPKLNIIVYAPRYENITYQHSIEQKNLKVKYVWERNSLSYPIELAKAICKDGVRVVHIQHEYWLYGRGLRSLLLLFLLVILRIMLRKVVLTIHGLIPVLPGRGHLPKYHKMNLPCKLLRPLMIIYVKLLCMLANVVIVHLNIMERVLVEQYGISPRKIQVIRHGIPNVKNVRKSLCKHYIFLVFGSIRPDKGIEQVIEAFGRLRRKQTSAKLIIAGSYNPQISPESAGYLGKLIEMIETMKIDDVELRVNVPSDELAKLFNEAYAVILNYLDASVLAASGPLTLAIAYGRPVIATRIPRFLEYRNYIIMVEPGNIDGIAKAMKALLEDKELYQSIRDKLTVLEKRDNWCNIAKEHLKLYGELLRSCSQRI